MVRITARQKVLAFIRRRNFASAAQIGQGLGMSAATVRHHLSILTADGRILANDVRPSGKRGRPEKLYRLSDMAAGENTGVLSDIALTAWLQNGPAAQRENAMRSLAVRLSELMGPVDPGLPAPKRIVQLTERLNDMHYHARWEAGAEGPRVMFGHCPYARIIESHPELCMMDTFLMSVSLGADVEQLSKIEQRAGGTSQCIFAVRRRSRAGG